VFFLHLIRQKQSQALSISPVVVYVQYCDYVSLYRLTHMLNKDECLIL